MTVTKYKLVKGNALRAPFETEEEVAAYMLEHQDAIAAYNASKTYVQPVSRKTPTMLSALGNMLVGDQFDDAKTEPETSKPSGLASTLLDAQTIKLMKATFA